MPGIEIFPAPAPAGLPDETALTINQVAERYGVIKGTVWRWMRHGLIGADGTRVFLEALKVGGRWRIDAAAISRFAAALTPPAPRQGVDRG